MDGMYCGTILKSRDGVPHPTTPPPGIDLAYEARTARSRFYPVTVVYTAYALVVLVLGLRADVGTALLFIVAGATGWTLLEYLVHRYVLHGRFPDGSGWLRHRLHLLFDSSHGDHHQRPWDGRHINGGFATVPFAAVLALAGLLAPLATLPVFVATILQCYVIEEWIHYAVHFHRIPWRYFSYIRKHHLYHHSGRGGDVAFGLSSGIWDVPLRTRIPSMARRLLHRRSEPSSLRLGRLNVSRQTPRVLVLAMLATSACLCAEAQERSRAFSLGTGWTDYGAQGAQAWEARVEYSEGRTNHPFRSILAATLTRDRSEFLGAGIGYELRLGRNWIALPSFVPGYYRRGNGRDLGWPLEFRSQLELGYQFGGGHRLLIAISHLSNAGLGHGNPGEESLSLAWEVPLSRPPAH